MESGGSAAEAVERAFEAGLPFGGGKQSGQRCGEKIALRHAAQLLEIAIRQDGMRQFERVAVHRRFRQNVPLLADITDERHHHLFADGIDGRVGDLREKLLEVIEQRLRLVGQAGERRIGSHGADRLLAVYRHRSHQEAHVLIGVTEGALAHQEGRVIGTVNARRFVQMVQRDLILRQPGGIGLPAGELFLDLTIGNNTALFQIHQEHLARLQAAFHPNVFGLHRQHAGLRRQHHHVVFGDQIARRDAGRCGRASRR